MSFLFYVSLILIVYGSLYPFDFSLGALGNVDMAMFLTDWRLYSSRGDLLGNISLFLPYGFSACWRSAENNPGPRGSSRSQCSGFSAATIPGGVLDFSRSPCFRSALAAPWRATGRRAAGCPSSLCRSMRSPRLW